MAYDDRLVVTSEDMTKTVTCYLDFLDELNPDRQKDPTAIRIKRSINTEPLLAYPNPTDNQFYLKGLSEGEVIYVTNIMGRTLQISSSE